MHICLPIDGRYMPVRASHKLIVRFQPDVAKIEPFGLNATTMVFRCIACEEYFFQLFVLIF